MQSTAARSKRSRLTAEAATALAGYGARTTWPPGFQIYQRGTPADGLSVVLRGHVILRSRVKSGKGFVPDLVTPGETFGIEGISPEQTYVTDACASDETETLFVSGTQFRAFVRECPGDALAVIAQMMHERACLLERLQSMSSQNVEQRLTQALHRLAGDRSFLSDDGRLRIEVRHHRLLCEMVGATRESIALALGRLVGSGVAEREGAEFIIAPSNLTPHIAGDGLDIESGIPLTTESAAT